MEFILFVCPFSMVKENEVGAVCGSGVDEEGPLKTVKCVTLCVFPCLVNNCLAADCLVFYFQSNLSRKRVHGTCFSMKPFGSSLVLSMFLQHLPPFPL